MKIVRVQYTTKPSFVKQNQENIRGIAEELSRLNHPGISYSTYLLDDGKTFMHFDQFADEQAHLVLQGLESFKKFAQELEQAGFEAAPELKLLSRVV